VQEFLASFYLWAKSLHVISMVAWMAGLFYLPRIFVYHAEKAPVGGETDAVFKIMERKLLRFIMNPAMITTWLLGIILLMTPGTVLWSSDFWIYPKVAAVFVLTWFHHWCGCRQRDFERAENTRSGRSYRIMNEIPTLTLIAIVVLAIVKPI
jgi:protoporphyrinogen IX oxidase